MPPTHQDIEVSAVMPCLNEERTIGVCVQKALNAFAALGVTGEVVVCDNGSSDRSVETAESLGARVVHEVVKGYGAALNAGIRASRGRYCIMADCDDSYDWSAIGPFIEKMREGYDMVVGTRLRGTIKPGAMPPLHRFFGNPFLSGLMNLFFRTGVSDAYCGMRAFSKKVYENLGVQAQGMEFAIEMIVRASNQRLSITEIPITLYVDGRGRPAHLRTFVDGWRTLRLLLLYAPDYLYVIPGAALFMVGAFLQALLLRGPTLLAGHYLGIHWLALGCLFCLTGFQVLCFGALAKAFAMNESFAMRGRLFDRFFRKFTLEIGIALGAFLIWMGLLADIAILSTWLVRGMGSLGSTHVVFVATTVIALGVQVVFASFFMGMLRIGISERRR